MAGLTFIIIPLWDGDWLQVFFECTFEKNSNDAGEIWQDIESYKIQDAVVHMAEGGSRIIREISPVMRILINAYVEDNEPILFENMRNV